MAALSQTNMLCRIPDAAVLARLPSLKGPDRKKPSVKPSGGVLTFLHRLRPHKPGINRVANRDPSTSRSSFDGKNAWQALSETSGSEDNKVRSAGKFIAWQACCPFSSCLDCFVNFAFLH